MVEHNQSANVPSGVGYDNKYKFNGKELDDATQMYYYGARYYDPRISIFVSVDPLAEEYRDWNPYNYTMNNPINIIDPTGMGPETDYFDSYGNFEKRVNDGSNAVKIYAANTKKYISPSKMEVTRGSNSALLKMAKYYRNEMKVSNKYLMGVAPSSSGASGKENPAFTRRTNNINYFNNRGGYSPGLDDANSFKSIIRHENKHQINNGNPNFTDKGNITHAAVYLYQMKHQEFSDSPYQFQNSMVGSYMNYLYNYQEKGGDLFDIQDSIESFNGLNTGFSIEQPSGPRSGTPKVESYDVKYKGKNIGKPQYNLNNEE